MSGLAKEWGTVAVAFILSFAITAGLYAPKEECEEPTTATVSAAPVQ